MFIKEELINHYVQGLRPAVREFLTQKLPRVPLEESAKLSAVRQVAAAIGSSQRALLNEGEKEKKDAGRTSVDGKEKATRVGSK